MRYEDASQAVSNGHSEPVARPDVDTLPAGSFGPVTGNAISGEGTTSGAAGADQVGAVPATITEVQGAGGAAIVANGNFQANGQFGVLSMDAQGNFNYVRNPNTPDGVKDVFNYTVADATGASASTTLTIDIAQVAAAAAGQGVVALPAGVELSDIHVNGRDLVINMPDGTQMVIPNGAVFVPEISIGDVQVPASNVAALLVNSEPQPAAGQLGESGGNWNDPIPSLDPGAPLGDLIPPTDFGYKPPVFEQIDNAVDRQPTIIIETPDNPAGAIDAAESVFEKGLPTRNGGEPAGSGEIADGNAGNDSDPSEANTGTIVFTAEDGLDTITVNGTAITAVGQTIEGQFGTMTITGIDLDNGQITYTYTLADNTSGDATKDVFTVVITDDDGDQATGTLTVNIVDDLPTARNDTDTTDLVNHVATGNVITGADTTSGSAGADTVGADNATLTAISSNGTAQSDTSFDASGNLVVEGQFGTLTIKADGSYTYTAHADAPGGSSDVFTYTLTDGDGDTSQATLTITNPDHAPSAGQNGLVVVDDDDVVGANGNPGGVGDDDPQNTSGKLSGSGGDGTLTFALTDDGTHPDGFTYSLQSNGDLWVMQGSSHVLTITVDSAGNYTVTEVAPIAHPPGGDENNLDFAITYTVTDADGDSVNGTLNITVDDDTPVAHNDTDSVGTGDSTNGNVITGVGTTSGASGADSFGADGSGGLTGISSNFTHQSDTSFDASGNLVVHGEFGTLTIKADGSYSYTLDSNAHGGGNDVFTYTIMDGDGDPTTATLTITVPLQNGAPTAEDSSVNVSEEGLVGGIADSTGSPDTTDSPTASGTISASDPDGDPLTITLGVPSGSFTSGGETVNWAVSPDGHTLTGYTGNDPSANHVVVVTMHADGTYDVQLIQPFDDPNSSIEDSITFVVPVTVSDSHGGSTDVHINVTVEDDSPTVDVTASSDARITLETQDAQTIGSASDTAHSDANFSGVFSVTSAAGADGAAAPVVTYTLGATDHTDSGLTQTGQTIWLYELDDGSVVGSTSNTEAGVDAANTVFSVTAASDGTVTLTQFSQIDHPIADDPSATGAPFDDQTISLADSAITLTASATITDNDGDHATDSETINIGANIVFDDDGPSVTNVQEGNGVNLDETTAGSPAGFPISATSADAAISADISTGADAPASTTYGLTITGDTGSGVASGLETAIGDHPITLVQIDADTIEGQYQDGGTQVAFTIEIGSDGKITVTQDVPLQHLDPNDANDAIDLSGLVNATVTVTDYDGDTATGSAAIGDNIVFFDDGPSIDVTKGSDANVILETQDAQTIGGSSDTAHSSANFGGVFGLTFSGGGDGAASTPTLTYTLGATDHTNSGLTQTGQTIWLYQLADGSVVGSTSNTEGGVSAGNTVFSVTAASDGTVTLTQFSQIDHPIADDPSATATPFDDQTISLADGAITLTASATITDNDGDTRTDSETVNIGANIVFDDDGPSVTAVAGASSITLDETDAGDVTGFPLSVTSADPMITATVAVGADTPGTTTYGLALAGGANSVDSGVQTAQGDHEITLVQIDADTIEGQYEDGGTKVAFTIQMNSDGTVTYTQNVPLEHSDDGDTAIAYNDTNSPITFDGLVFATVTVTDYDGDTASGSTNIGDQIQVFDDGPTAINPDSIVTTDDVQGPITASLDLPDNSVVDNFGADGPGTITFANITNGMDSGLTSNGNEIDYFLSNNGQTLEARTGGASGTLIFTVAIDQDNSHYVYNQYAVVDNGSGVEFNDLTSTKAGNVDIYGLGAGTTGNPDVDAMLSASNGATQKTINTDSTSIGVGNQSMNPNDSLRIDFVSHLTANNSNATTGFDYNSHVETNLFEQTVPQVVGQPSTVSFKVWALESSDTQSDFPDSNPAGGFADSSTVFITEVGITGHNAGEVKETFDISGLANGATMVLDYGISVTRNADGSVTFSGIEQGDKYEIGTGANTFNAVDVEDVTGKFDLGVFALGTTNFGSPVDLSYDLQVTDSDGDSVTVPGGINIELDPTGQVNNNAQTSSVNSTSSTSSSSLLPGNDNHHPIDHSRPFAVGQNVTLMAAIAAAGLEAEHAKIDWHAAGHLSGHQPSMVPLEAPAIASNAIEADSKVAPAHVVEPLVASHAISPTAGGGHYHEPLQPLHVAVVADVKLGAGVTELLHGSGPAHAAPPTAGSVTAHAVAMPSAQALAAALAPHGPAQPDAGAGTDGAQHNQVVSKVVADALNGGDPHGPSIDGLLNTLPGHGGAHDALEALAAQGAAMAFHGMAAGYGAPHALLSVEMVMQQHAPPPAHG